MELLTAEVFPARQIDSTSSVSKPKLGVIATTIMNMSNAQAPGANGAVCCAGHPALVSGTPEDVKFLSLFILHNTVFENVNVFLCDILPRILIYGSK